MNPGYCGGDARELYEHATKIVALSGWAPSARKPAYGIVTALALEWSMAFRYSLPDTSTAGASFGIGQRDDLHVCRLISRGKVSKMRRNQAMPRRGPDVIRKPSISFSAKRIRSCGARRVNRIMIADRNGSQYRPGYNIQLVDKYLLRRSRELSRSDGHLPLRHAHLNPAQIDDALAPMQLVAAKRSSRRRTCTLPGLLCSAQPRFSAVSRCGVDLCG